jgi:bifunctional non-homologous end joining protein LigD
MPGRRKSGAGRLPGKGRCGVTPAGSRRERNRIQFDALPRLSARDLHQDSPDPYTNHGRIAAMALETYRRKRRFDRTPEPKGTVASKPQHRFVVQKHAASRLHYDFRLEIGGVLKSWAVPKGPSLDPKEKRLAVPTEDHPIEYADFEGVIPEDQYGGGAMILWDRGIWDPHDDPEEGLRRGNLKFRLEGEKLRGEWALVRMRGRSSDGDKNWLLVKSRDEAARPLDEFDVLEAEPQSVVSGRTVEEVRAGKKTSRKASTKRKTAGAAKPESRIAHERQTTTGSRDASRASALEGARRAPMPESIKPALATLVHAPPEGDGWLHEIKFDGYRVLCRIRGGKATLLTRNDQDWTEKFSSVAAAAERLPVDEALLDGEVVVLLPNGLSDFQSLQNVLRENRQEDLVYYAFDLLYLEGYDLRKVPLIDRKTRLADLLRGTKVERLEFTDHMEGHGPEFFEQACRTGLEGIVSKRRSGPYPTGRTPSWLKAKCIRRDEFVVGGFTDSTAAERAIGALLVGYYDQGRFRYAGRVGTGFGSDTLADLRRRFKSIERADSPFKGPHAPSPSRGTHWLEPKLVAEVAYGSWTRDGLLRHPSFQGLREDKPAEEVQRPETFTVDPVKSKPSSRRGHSSKTPASAAGVRITHPDRVLYEDQGVTKIGLASYYVEAADWILPHIADRPLSLLRCPQGRSKSCFFQKHAQPGTAEELGRVAIREKEKQEEYLYIRDVAGLVALVQMGVLEIHPWAARRDNVERPDRVIFDFDPDVGLPWDYVLEAAFAARVLLEEELGLVGFVKTTGGKGLHVVVPIQRRRTWPEVKAFAKAVAERMTADAPNRLTTTLSKAARRGKIFVDYLRNDRGATAVAPYSARAKSGAPVSVPLAWDELSSAVRSDHFTLANLPGRLESLAKDPWEGFFDVRQALTAAAMRRLGL